MRDVCSLIWLALIGLFRSRASLQAEILTLRHQLNVLRRKSPQRLTANDLSEGLDDGEAATIAYAVAHSAATVPVVDERKATRIFRKRWSDRVAIGTMALISNDRILTSLPQEHLREAVYSALIHARMRVPNDSREWAIELIGMERAAACPSLAFGRQ
jgi:hypothetical protein